MELWPITSDAFIEFLATFLINAIVDVIDPLNIWAKASLSCEINGVMHS